jgi:hypothetical protein
MTTLEKATRPGVLDDVEHIADHLRAAGLLPEGPVPMQRLGLGTTAAVRFGDIVVKRMDAGQLSLVAELGSQLPGVSPEIVWADDISELLITRFVPGAQWGRQLTSSRIDSRTFAAAGSVLRSVHSSSIAGPRRHRPPLNGGGDARGRRLIAAIECVDAKLRGSRAVLLHGAFEPDNVVVAAAQRLIMTDWRGAGYGPAELDVAQLLACLIAYTVAQPYTEDWYIDAGRAFLDSYGAVDSAVLRPLIGLELLAATSAAVHRVQSEHSVRTMLRERAFALLLDDDPLPW